mmetsp:Transcript_14249/g.34755  ORF Transcript_14249/g.34755 Transcript_14249/m.34755 type:complete len:240 (+) Transcript_14249:732-1451(+)
MTIWVQLSKVRVQHFPLIVMTVWFIQGGPERVNRHVDSSTVSFKFKQLLHYCPGLPSNLSGVVVHILEQVLLEHVHHNIKFHLQCKLFESTSIVFFLVIPIQLREEVLPEVFGNGCINQERVEKICQKVILLVEGNNAVQMRIGPKRICILQGLDNFLRFICFLDRNDEFTEIVDHRAICDHIKEGLKDSSCVHPQILKFTEKLFLACIHEFFRVDVHLLINTPRHCRDPLSVIRVGQS